MSPALWHHAVVSGCLRWITAAIATLAFTQADAGREYVDQGRRFRFSYPAAFGAPSTGTNDGFEDRVAAIRFATFSSGIGGEAALTRGLPVIDIQAVGGLYDAIALEVFPEPMRRLIVAALPPLSITNFCQLLAQEQHLDPQVAALSPLTAPQKAVVTSVDRMRNVSPRVIQCVVSGPTVTFDKEVGFQPGGPRQHVYGAVRFLEAPYTTFQIVRAGPVPDPAVLSQMTACDRGAVSETGRRDRLHPVPRETTSTSAAAPTAAASAVVDSIDLVHI